MPATNNPVLVPQQELDELAGVIRTEHQAVGLAAKNMLEHALRAGDALHAAKRQVAEGSWKSWVRKRCDLSLRCAQVYMQLAAARPQIEAQAQHAAPHSLRAVLNLIGSKQQPRNTANKIKPATSFDALGWWSTAPLEQRRHFLVGAGRTSLHEAQPPAWRDSTGEGMGRDIGADSSVGAELACLRTRVEELERELEEGKAELDPDLALMVAIDNVTLEQCLQAMPQSWRDALEQQATEHLSAEQLLRLLEAKPECTPKTRALLKEIREALRRPPPLELTADSTADKATLPAVTIGSPFCVSDETFDGYTKWSLEKLEDRILSIRCSTGRGTQLTPTQWKKFDRMRARADELKRAVVASVQAHGSTMGGTKH